MADRLPPPFDLAWQDAQVIELEADFESRTVRLRLCDPDGDEMELAFGGVTHLELDQALGFEVKRVEHRQADGRQVLMLFDEDDDEMARVTFRTAARVHLAE